MLDANLVRVSREFGEAMARWYESPEGRASLSRSRSGDWGAERDPIRLGQSKAGEYAVAVYFALDAKIAVKRSFGKADAGTDVKINSNLGSDVKTTPTWKRYMLWSREINDLYWSKQFDVLIGVSIDEDDWSQCWIEGWLTKQEFFDRKKIADGTNDEGRLSSGTWFIEKDELSDIDTLLTDSRRGFVGYDKEGRFVHYCHCGKWGSISIGASTLHDKLGTWFCQEHHPNERFRGPASSSG